MVSQASAPAIQTKTGSTGTYTPKKTLPTKNQRQ